MITVEDFAEIAEVTTSNIYQMKYRGDIAEGAFLREKDILMVDETFFYRRQDFKRKLKNFNQDAYLVIADKYKDLHIARMICEKFPEESVGSINVFLGTNLFRTESLSVMVYKVSYLHWKFFKFAREYVRINKIDIDVELDAMMNRDD